MRALDALTAQHVAETDLVEVGRWPLGRLIDHIVGTHHRYVRRALPIIGHRLVSLRKAHGERHPELACISDTFDQMTSDLERHLLKEEQILFPYIRELAERAEQHRDVCVSPFGTIANPITMMEREHREVADALHVIRELTHGYTTPEDGCATYAVCMAELAEFERDLHRHVHLENNVLFPRAIELEDVPSDD
jgi:regulator of cell morphogenesis and NO signaling